MLVGWVGCGKERRYGEDSSWVRSWEGGREEVR